MARGFIGTAFRSNRAVRSLVTASRHRYVQETDAFIVSYPRSGNTWVKLALIHALTGKPCELEDQDRLVPYVGSHRDAPLLLPNRGRLIKSHEPYRASFSSAYRHGVYIVRDGRDVAVSYFYYQLRRGFSGSFHAFLDQFLAGRIAGYGSWHQHVLSWADSEPVRLGRITVVRYEDLVESPVVTFPSVLRSIGVDSATVPLAEVLEATSFARLQERDAAIANDPKRNPTGIPFFRSGRPGAWIEKFTSAETKSFEAVSGEALRRFGYLSH